MNSGIMHADHTAAQLSTERVQQRIVEHTQSLDPVKDVLVVIQKQVPVQRMVETPQLRFIDNVVDVPVVAQRQIPINQFVQKTVEIPQLDVVEKIVETPETQTFQGTQTFVSLNTAEQTLDVPVPEMVELPTIVSQDRIQQRTLEQIVDTPVPQIVEELAEASKVFSQEKSSTAFWRTDCRTPCYFTR